MTAEQQEQLHKNQIMKADAMKDARLKMMQKAQRGANQHMIHHNQ